MQETSHFIFALKHKREAGDLYVCIIL